MIRGGRKEQKIMKNFRRKRQYSVLAVLLAFCMIAGSIPQPSYAQQVSEIAQESEPAEIVSEEDGQETEPTEA